MRISYLDGIFLPTEVGATTAKVDELKIGDDRTAAVYPDRAGAQPIAVDFLGAPNLAEDMFRTIGQSDVAQTPVDPLTTAIVVGKQFRSAGWVDLFFPPTLPLESATSGLARSLTFRYQVWGDSHLDEYDTSLPEGTPWPFSGLDVVWEPGKMEPHGWASLVTMEEAARAVPSLNWIARKAALPMTIINRALQFSAARKLLDPTAEATFATGHVTNKAPGTEWDQPGTDMQVDAEMAIQTIASKVTVDRRAIVCVMSEKSYSAALRNTGFKEWHSGVLVPQGTDYSVNEVRLAQYLNVGQVHIINPTGKAGRPMFDDVAWFFARPFDLEDYDDSYGAERFAARFAANDGVVLESWTERMIRSTLYPAMKEYALEILNPGAAYLYTNTSST